MPKDAIWVRDVTQNNTTWDNRIFPVIARTRACSAGAGIGQDCRSVLGGGGSDGRKTVVMTGDGGSMRGTVDRSAEDRR